MVKWGYQKISKYIKYLLFCIPIVLASVFVLGDFSKGYYDSLKVTYGENGYPLLNVRLKDRDYILVVDVGSFFPLSLSKEVLEKIDKQANNTILVQDINGQKREAPAYLIQEVKVGKLKSQDITAYESQKAENGVLGKFLGEELNLLIDFPHSRIIACDTFDKLQKKKLVDRDWICVPFEMHRGGIVFKVDTDFGICRLAINTTSTFTCIGSSFISSGTSFVSSAFSLGGQQFGNVRFESIDLPEGLKGIDGFIGMDFLKEHAIYFDNKKHLAYLEPIKKYFESIPVIVGPRNNVIIDVSIEQDVYPLKLDLGSFMSFSLSQEILENINKTKYGFSKWHDFRGKSYESPLYAIPEIKIGNLSFTNAFANQDSKEFHVNAAIDYSPEPLPGVIGCPILHKYNFLFDFPHSTIYACNDCLSLQKRGLLSTNLLTVPFTPHFDGIILSVETDRGIYRLMLDTGATYTVVRAPHPDCTEVFRIAGHDFGKFFIKTLDVATSFDFDGAIGMDFFLQYRVFIDYANKVVHIDLEKDLV